VHSFVFDCCSNHADLEMSEELHAFMLNAYTPHLRKLVQVLKDLG
jgi:hypothetical protein